MKHVNDETTEKQTATDYRIDNAAHLTDVEEIDAAANLESFASFDPMSTVYGIYDMQITDGDALATFVTYSNYYNL